MMRFLNRTKGLLHSILASITARIYLRKAELHGQRIRLWGKPSVKGQGRLIVENRVQLVSTITPIEFDVSSGGMIEIGEFTYINYGTSIAAKRLVKIGKKCLIGTYVNITDNNFHCVEPERRYEIPPSEPVIIEDNVWLGTRVIVLPGVTIGEGSVIGAGSVVTRNIPARVLAAGVPARVIREL